MKKFILVMILVMAVLFSSSNVTMANQTMYGGSDEDGAQCIANTSDGGYIVAGESYSNYITGIKKHVQDYNVYVIKFNSSGTVVWKNIYYGGVASSIQQTSDGGYIIAGGQWPFQAPYQAFVLKLDSKGTVIWQKAYDGLKASSIQQTSDGGYIAAGYDYSTDHDGYDYYVVKLDSNGNVMWQNMYGGSGKDYAYSIQQTGDGGYIVAGYSNSTDISGIINHGGYDYYVIKLDGNGAIEWQKMYGGSGDDYAYSIRQTLDGGYIVAGYSNSTDIGGITNHGDADVLVIKLDSSGDIEWQKMYGGSGKDNAYSIRQTLDGGYIIAGTSNSTNISGVTNHGGFDAYVIKLDSSGNAAWQKMYGGSKTKSYLHVSWPPNSYTYTTDPSHDYAYDVVQRSNGGYIVVGESNSADISGATLHGTYTTDVYVIKLNANGAL